MNSVKKPQVHMMLQPKGGIGKTFSISMLAQHLKSLYDNVLIIDIDQENPTLSQYQALSVQRVSVMGDGHAIDPKLFDNLMMLIINHDGDVIVDTGANTFSALMAYAIENSVFDVIKESGKDLVIHTIVGGGDTLYDTANGFADIADFVDGNIVLWLNEHFGTLATNTGIPIENTPVYKDNQGKLIGTITLNRRTSSTFGADINKMTAARLTFDEVETSGKFNVMEKNRLRIVRKDVFSQLERIAA